MNCVLKDSMYLLVGLHSYIRHVCGLKVNIGIMFGIFIYQVYKNVICVNIQHSFLCLSKYAPILEKLIIIVYIENNRFVPWIRKISQQSVDNCRVSWGRILIHSRVELVKFLIYGTYLLFGLSCHKLCKLYMNSYFHNFYK